MIGDARSAERYSTYFLSFHCLLLRILRRRRLSSVLVSARSSSHLLCRHHYRMQSTPGFAAHFLGKPLWGRSRQRLVADSIDRLGDSFPPSASSSAAIAIVFRIIFIAIASPYRSVAPSGDQAVEAWFWLRRSFAAFLS